MGEVRLTAGEREALAKAVVGDFIDHRNHNPSHGLGVFDRSRCDRLVAPAVEAILTARLAAVEALADEWEAKYEAHIAAATTEESALTAALQVASGSVRKLCAADLRAALGTAAQDGEVGAGE